MAGYPTRVQANTSRDVLPRLLGFCLSLFLLSCIFDPADKVLSLKVYIFALCWVITAALYWSSRESIGVPRGLLIYTLLFILVPVYSIVWYFLTDGGAPYKGFSMLKGYVLITLAPMLVIGRIDLLPKLCSVLTVLAFAIIGVFIAVQLDERIFALMYLIGTQTDVLSVQDRAYAAGVVLTQVYFTTSPMLAIAIAYYFEKAYGARRTGEAMLLWGLVDVSVVGMFLAGTRNNILVSMLLPAALVFYFARNKVLGAVFSLIALAALVVLFFPALEAFFNPLEKSNSVKLRMLSDYARILSEPINLIFGKGLGAYEYWEGRGTRYVTELTYHEMIRNFGLIGSLVMIGLLLFPVWHAFTVNQSRRDKAIAIGFCAYLGMCASNPHLFSSTGILILSVMLGAIFLPRRAVFASPRSVVAQSTVTPLLPTPARL